MVYDRGRGGYGDRSVGADYGQDYGAARDYTFSSARDYEAAGEIGPDRDREANREGGRRDYGNRGYGNRERMYGGPGYGSGRGRGFDDRSAGGQGGGEPYRGSYAHDGHRFEDVGRDEGRSGGRDRGDRGFLDRAADEVRSWFGDDDHRSGDDRSEARGGQRVSGNWQGDRVHDHRDRHYHEWRQGQISQLDRDYDEYRREHQSKFENEFSTWRTGRQGQRQMLGQVQEHAEVLGSDGEKIGTVDHVLGDRIKLTKNDPEAGGHHHTIPSSWIKSVEGGTVMLSKSATEAKTMWREEADRQEKGGMSGGDRTDQSAQPRGDQGGMLNRSFSGTYDEK